MIINARASTVALVNEMDMSRIVETENVLRTCHKIYAGKIYKKEIKVNNLQVPDCPK